MHLHQKPRLCVDFSTLTVIKHQSWRRYYRCWMRFSLLNNCQINPLQTSLLLRTSDMLYAWLWSNSCTFSTNERYKIACFNELKHNTKECPTCPSTGQPIGSWETVRKLEIRLCSLHKRVQCRRSLGSIRYELIFDRTSAVELIFSGKSRRPVSRLERGISFATTCHLLLFPPKHAL